MQVGTKAGATIGAFLGAKVGVHPVEQIADHWWDPRRLAGSSGVLDSLGGIELVNTGTYHAANANLGGNAGYRFATTQYLRSGAVFGGLLDGPFSLFCEWYIPTSGAYRWVCGITTGGTSTEGHAGLWLDPGLNHYAQVRNDAGTTVSTSTAASVLGAHTWSMLIHDPGAGLRIVSPAGDSTVAPASPPVAGSRLWAGSAPGWPSAPDIGQIVLCRRAISEAHVNVMKAFGNALIA